MGQEYRSPHTAFGHLVSNSGGWSFFSFANTFFSRLQVRSYIKAYEEYLGAKQIFEGQKI